MAQLEGFQTVKPSRFLGAHVVLCPEGLKLYSLNTGIRGLSNQLAANTNITFMIVTNFGIMFFLGSGLFSVLDDVCCLRTKEPNFF